MSLDFPTKNNSVLTVLIGFRLPANKSLFQAFGLKALIMQRRATHIIQA